LLALGGLVFIVGEFERGTRLCEESLGQYDAVGDERGRARVLHRLANSALVDDDVARARSLVQESLELHRRFGNRKGEAAAIGTLADVEWRSGNRELARELAEKSRALASEAGFLWWELVMLYVLCEWSFELERADEAERVGREALEVAHRIGDRQYGVYLLALLARSAAEDGRLERAGLLWGAVEAEEQRAPVGQWEGEREAYAARVLAHTGSEFEPAREQGRRLSMGEAVDVALGSVD
jgi:tetratricopeptide (TPR) repeat protein